MKPEEKSLRLGAAVILCAILLRLLSGSLGDRIVTFLTSEKVAAVLLYMETGRVIRPVEAPAVTTPVMTPTVVPEETAEVTEPTIPQEIQDDLPAFSQEDALLVAVNSACGYSVDVQALLQQPLSWDLTGEAPTVLILHSHASESYTKTEEYTESTAYRTLDEHYNMVSIGDRLTQLLEDGGIHVIHDRTLHDYPSYSNSYINARASIEDYLAQYPSIQLVLDLHRDAMVDTKGNQLGYTISTEDGDAAQVMLVVGTDAGGMNHPNWEENMALAVKFHAQLEQLCPGICRPISFRSQRFNQDLSGGALLIEVGAAGNTRQEALLSADHLARCILALARGTVTADSTS